MGTQLPPHPLLLTPMPIRRPCLECRQLTTEPTRCPTCHGKREALRNASRPHYRGDYATRAAHIRATATHCHICGQGPRPDDPFQADHVFGPSSDILAPAHRSCNIRKGVASRDR